MSRRGGYQVVDIKADFLGPQNKPQQLQDVLNRQGAEGWELIQIIAGSHWVQKRLLFKKAV